MRYQISSIQLLKNMLQEIPEGDACMEWPRSCVTQGYGQLERDGKPVMAHRVAYEIVVGPIPEGHGVLHKCDNPPCFRPDHLFTGTTADNVHDCAAKGRRQQGETHGRAVLNETQVRTIRELYAGGAQQRELGKQFGVPHSTIGYIVRRETWAHVI